MSDRPIEGVGAWTVRRRFMTRVALFMAGLICVCLVAATVLALLGKLEMHTANLYGSTIDLALAALAAINATYVFGAAWQDISAMKTGAAYGTAYGPRDPYAAPSGGYDATPPGPSWN